ncbi:MAG: pilus assembly protein PilO [Zetaproteobacteria bacterium]|nr:MAG: pilus assembly protein PilO [Zetaproteobacteria bacterium]
MERLSSQLDRLLDACRPLLGYPMRQKVLALLVGLVLLAGLYDSLLWMPLQEEMDTLREQVQQQRDKLAHHQKLASKLPEKKQEYEQLRHDLQLALNMLPKKSQIDTLLADVSWAGKDAGLEFSTFAPQPEVRRELYAEVPVAISLSGSFKQLLSFLKRVGEMPRIVEVKELSIQRGKGRDALEVSGQVVTYRFVEPSKSAPAKGKRHGARQRQRR